MNQPFKAYYSSTSSGASPFLSACGAKSNMQAPENTQNYNRYAYCFNNPMKYTDPTGYNHGQPRVIIDDEIEWHGTADSYIRTHGANIDIIEYNGQELFNSNKFHWEEIQEKVGFTTGEETISYLKKVQNQTIEDFNNFDFSYLDGGPRDPSQPPIYINDEVVVGFIGSVSTYLDNGYTLNLALKEIGARSVKFGPMASVILKNAGYVAFFANFYLDYQKMQRNEITPLRFTYRTLGGLNSLGFAIYFNPYVGFGVGGAFYIGEKTYDALMYSAEEISKFCSDFNNSVGSGTWYPSIR